jgi:hypothetical protein
MTKKKFNNSKGDTWEWEESPEVSESIAKLQKITRQREISELESKAPDYGVGK